MKTIIIMGVLLAASPVAADTIARPRKTLAASASFSSVDDTGCVSLYGFVDAYRVTPLYGGDHEALHEVQVHATRIDACNGTFAFADGATLGGATLDGDVGVAGVHADIPVAGWPDATSLRVDVDWEAIDETCYQGMFVARFGGEPYESYLFRSSGTNCSAIATGVLTIADFTLAAVADSAWLADGDGTIVVGTHGGTIHTTIEGGYAYAYTHDPTGCQVTSTAVSFADMLLVETTSWDQCTGDLLTLARGETAAFTLDDGHVTAAFDGVDGIAGAAVPVAVDLTWTPDVGSCQRLLSVADGERTMETSCTATVTGTLQIGGVDISLAGGFAGTFEDRNGPP